MATLPVIAIVSPKDGVSRWVINLTEYDAARHVLWDERQEPTPPESGPGDEKPDDDAPVRKGRRR